MFLFLSFYKFYTKKTASVEATHLQFYDTTCEKNVKYCEKANLSLEVYSSF